MKEKEKRFLQATGKNHPLKRGAKLISLDNYYTQEYNKYDFCKHSINTSILEYNFCHRVRTCGIIAIFTLSLNVNLALANPLEPKNFIEPSVSNTNNAQNLEDLKANEYYLNLNPKEIKDTQKKDDEVKEALDRFSQKEINYKPVIRPIASMDTISLHPYFTFSLLLPAGSVIQYVDSSQAMAILKFENNALLVRPNADFRIANFTILYKLEDKNYVLNILAHLYEKNDELDKLNLVYSYVNDKKLDGLDVINAYIKENKSLPKQKYSYIQINDVSYRIVEDDKYGSIFINNKKYRVDNNTIYK